MITDKGMEHLLLAIFVEKHINLEQFADLDSARLALATSIEEVTLLQRSPARDRKILYLRFALEGGEPTTLRELAAQVDLSPERVRQIVTKLVRRLRHPARTRHYRPPTES